MQARFDPNLLNELIDLSHNPPGNDPVLGSFYAALVEIAEEGHSISKILLRVKKSRNDITYKHLVNLIFRAFQAIKLKQNDLSYRSFDDISKWRKELANLQGDKNARRDFEKLLRTKNTNTTIYQRYAGVYTIVSHLWNNHKVTMADLGCGGNYGLRGFELKEPFKEIRDLTPKRVVSKLLRKNINLEKGLAIDKEDPNLETTTFWRMACSFYPKELDEMNSILEFEKRIKLSAKIQFIKKNLLKLKLLPKFKVDVIILSTILYQLSLYEQLILLQKAKKLLKPEGMMIIQDFAAKNLANPRHLDFNDSWFSKTYSYRTFISSRKTGWKFWEIFQWNNGRCRIVKDGEDFDKIFKTRPNRNQLSTSSVALAHSTS